ncbi:NAD(P)H-hydrate dehydratase [Actibacterium lipolyticum]|uniref:Bifunctional NAD(P)H-hydrate repair enzyme n=1 Tax=Actibacterium lipolyticum TaxID=1524263 RepID=A0A238KHB4_9RHOB|nr:NAD(P)H-hydrate dehydratase [Actibacterium lipolyticum]SMX42181.1 Bifunctional NAD(P)H-hydrate repair enzyme Nnr [Actibacterium lipolyticum]
MTELLTSAQMRAIEQAAINSGEVTGLELMERAGRGVVEAVFEEWPELAKTSHRAAVLCGPGNNGGDGFVVARLLKEWGWEVDVFLYGDPAKLPPDAKVNYERWCKLAVVAPYIDDGEEAFSLEPDDYDVDSLVFDALFGTGLVRPVEAFNAFGWVTQISEWRLRINKQRQGGFPGPRIVAIDLPSGICADSGRYLSSGKQPRDYEAIRADLTVSFHQLKLGHRLGDGPTACGKSTVASIGLEASARPTVPPGEHTMLVERPDFLAPKHSGQHKYSHGHALILSGGLGKTGAARLAARGALRIGAGLVTVGAPQSAMAECAAQLTAIMLRRVDDADMLEDALDDDRLNALCLGPGLGLGRDTIALVKSVLATKRATVLDADALTSFTDAPEDLFELLHDKCVLTPHAGEFARLFPDIADKLNAPASNGPAYSKVDATRDAAKRAGCVVLFKGPDTVIAAPDGRCAINSAQYDRAAPWLATAGAGDVLAGFITGRMARGDAPMQAAEAAAWLHVECARKFGPGLIAEDLPETLPQVFRDLGL